MSEDREIPTTGRKVIVVMRPGSVLDREAVLALLVECGVEPDAVSFIEPAEVEDCVGLDGVPVILPIDEDTKDAIDLEACARHCAQAGGTVVVVFDAGFAFTGLHPIAADYGTQCGWSSDQLAPRMVPDADVPPLDSTGRPVERSKAHQVRCGG